LPGKIPYDDAPLWLAMGDVAVSAKVSATEGSGKLLNYMALGLPIVAYDTPVHREYLGDYGEYVPPHDMVGLAEALWSFCIDEPRRQERGRQLRQRVENTFTWPRAAAQIDALYGRLLGQAPPSG
jgi:glycosyltransferase involved in cell wall biosynthesis